MSKTNLIVIVLAVILIIVGIFIINNKPSLNKENKTDPIIESNEITVNRTVNENGEQEYVIYDKKTGAEKARVSDEHQLKIYELDPDYEELPVEILQEELNGKVPQEN